MRRKILYIMSFLITCFTIVFLFANASDNCTYAVTFDDLDMDSIIDAAAEKAGGSTVAIVGHSNTTDKETIYGEEYYTLYSSQTNIRIPIILVNAKSNDKKRYTFQYETRDFTALDGVDYTGASGYVYVMPYASNKSKVWGKTSTGVEYTYTYITVSASKTQQNIKNETYIEGSEQIYYSNSFIFEVIDSSLEMIEGEKAASIHLPGTINDKYITELNRTQFKGIYHNGYMRLSDVDDVDDDSSKERNYNCNFYDPIQREQLIDKDLMQQYVDAGLGDIYMRFYAEHDLSDNVTDTAIARVKCWDSSDNEVFNIYTTEDTDDGGALSTDPMFGAQNAVDTSKVLFQYDGYSVKVPNNKMDSFKLRFESNTWWTNTNFENMRAYFSIVDLNAPKVTNAYINTDNLSSDNQKVKYIMRFNEPVIATANTGFRAYVNSGLLSTTELYFKYVGGSMTNTLIFEADISAYQTQINKITPSGFYTGSSGSKLYEFTEDGVTYSFAGVTDMSTFKNKIVCDGNNITNAGSVECNIDARVPGVTIKHSNNILATHTTTFSLTTCSTGTLYYLFDQNNETPTDWTAATKVEYTAGSDGTFNKSITTSGLDGIWYIHVKVITSYGTILNDSDINYNDTTSNGNRYKFDNSGPKVSYSQKDGSTPKVRTFIINASDLPTDTTPNSAIGVKTIYARILDAEETVLYELEKNTDSTFQFSVYANDSEQTYNLALGDGERGTYIIEFWAVDELQNESETKRISVQFDTNDYFEGEMIPTESEETVISNDAVAKEIIVVSKVDTTNSTDEKTVYLPSQFTVTFTDPTSADSVYETINLVTLVDSSKQSLLDDTINYTGTNTNDNVTIKFENNDSTNENERRVIITFDGNATGYLSYGYYDLRVATTSNRSFVYRIYIGSNNEETSNITNIYNTKIVLNNVVKFDDNYANFYYLDDTDNIFSVKTVRYHATATTSNPVFSSTLVAREFITAMEYRDVKAIKLSSEQADNLAKSNGGYVKASGETATPATGQIWLRYKISSWTYSSASSTWRYYFYSSSGSTTDVNPNAFSANLVNAINSVTDTIAASIYSDYLVDDVDDNGNPKLSSVAIFPDSITINSSYGGTTFTTPILFSGDDDIYINDIKYEGNSYKLATNYEFDMSVNTRLYFYDEEDDMYIRIPYSYNGVNIYTALSELTTIDTDDTSSKLITLCEFDDSGSEMIQVYLDKEAPSVMLTIVDANGDSGTRTISIESKNITLTGTSIALNKLIDDDEYSYLVLRRYLRTGVGEFIAFYRLEDIEKNMPVLTSGNYIITVSDRSGNEYSLYIFIDDTALEVTKSVQVNEYFKINCNRSLNQIALFEVYFNDKLVTNDYDLTIRYTNSGLYRIKVIDIYGNEHDEYYEFERDYPTVSWSYYVNGVYTKYQTPDGTETVPMSLTATGEGEITIVTNTSLLFTFESSCGFEFLTEPTNYTYREMSNTVLIGASGDVSEFVLKIYYTNLQNLYTTYICHVDTSAPQVIARCTVTNFNLNTDDDIISVVDGKIVVPTSFWYTKISDAQYNYIIEHETVTSSSDIQIVISDEHDIYSIIVYLDDKMIKEYYGTDSIELTYEKYGIYKIVSTDIYGNKGEFVFENRKSSYFEYQIDGNVIDLETDLTSNFDDNTKAFKKVEYGNSSISYTFKENGIIRLKLTHGDVCDFAILKFDSGVLYYCKYEVNPDTTEGASPYVITEYERFALTTETIGKITISGMSFTYTYEIIEGTYINHENLQFTFDVIDDTEYLIEMRFDALGRTPYYCKSGISTFVTKADFYDRDEMLMEIGESNDVKLSSEFMIKPSDGKASIIVLYDAAGHYIYNKNIYEEGKYYTDEGAYQITVTNKYGNVIVYNVIFYKSYLVNVELSYEDGFVVKKQNPSDVYSNYSITLYLYDESEITVTKDGEPYSVISKKTNDVISYAISDEGDYQIHLVNIYNNVYDLDAHILKKSIKETDLLSGFNENALRLGEGYTNQLLTINYSTVINYSYLAVKKDYNNEVVLYDKLSGDIPTLDANQLIDYVGKDGNGIYEVTIRDIYGNKYDQVVTYRGDSTLNLSRRNRTAVDDEVYDLEFALDKGFWSNNNLLFATEASIYQFYVNDKLMSLPYKLAYANTNNEGYYSYTIKYIDEYGFSYTFMAYLVRKNITLELDENVPFETVNGVITTRYPFTMKYENADSCSYYLNSVEHLYENETISLDGTYRFVATDLAGNSESFMIVKDSIVDFAFRNTASAKDVIFGETITLLRMTFTSTNGDSSYIKAMFKDGEEITEIDATVATAGKYEFLIGDLVGNETYFKFTMINNVVGSFEYETPYSYIVTAVTFHTKILQDISYMEYVDQFEDHSYMKFSEDGYYTVTTHSKDTGEVINLSFEINTAPPAATLSGVEDGGVTTNNVTLKNLKQNDKVEVYKDGKLVNTYYTSMDGESIASISDGGNYKIVVTNAAGVSKTLTFTRKHTANAAGSALVIIFSVVAIGLIFFGILQHNKKKTDN